MNIKLLLCQKLSEKLPNELIEMIFIYSKTPNWLNVYERYLSINYESSNNGIDMY